MPKQPPNMYDVQRHEPNHTPPTQPSVGACNQPDPWAQWQRSDGQREPSSNWGQAQPANCWPQSNSYAHGQGSYDAYGNYNNPSHTRPFWKINRKETDGLFKFDGELANYRAWKSRIRDHAAEEWAAWRQILDHAETVGRELSMEELERTTLFGVNGALLSNDLWSFLLRWIGPTLYLRRTRMGPSAEGNGIELWRRLFTEYQGSDELIKLAGRTKLLDFAQCRTL